MPTAIAVLGDGAMGTACALVLASKPDHRVTLWSARPENGRLLQKHRENRRLLPGIPIPEAVQLSLDLDAALQAADLVVWAIPTVYLRPTLAPLAARLRAHPAPAVSVAKGLEMGTFQRPSEILAELTGARPLAVISGPGHAEEIARGLPTGLVVASADAELASWVQRLFSTDRFRLYTNADVIGVELAGALKNVYAIAAGISDGLGFGDNAKASLMTRSLVEMVRFGEAHGGQRSTIFGLAGIGDLITTCVSPHGRNRAVGMRIGRGEKLAAILTSMSQVAEGVYTTRSVQERIVAMGLNMPIATEVYRMLYEDKSPRTAVQDLMSRDLKSELA
ncbi:MAG TPA: NAD(P)H-dependent glycerol-3-phosphate dehydrogenase [Gemmatales bacterium]|nr:NAD(P)H-dependent glycerol-3-phosphate dehydrogenase [Gemmatales bacterium]HMP61319.1 NAD(P)H-dependent glycerol-3-phosphate dehydrogenase [Gemmatales bacterium]